jgi:hypothetical protein
MLEPGYVGIFLGCASAFLIIILNISRESKKKHSIVDKKMYIEKSTGTCKHKPSTPKAFNQIEDLMKHNPAPSLIYQFH